MPMENPSHELPPPSRHQGGQHVLAAAGSIPGVVVFGLMLALVLGDGLVWWQDVSGRAEALGSTALAAPRGNTPTFFDQREVGFTHGPIHFSGVLNLPPGEGLFPAIFLLTGSGAQDRDGEMFGHKRHLVLAEAMTRAGIAVLRVDDRGVGGSTGHLALATNADLAGDGWAGVQFLRQQPEIDPDRVCLYGPSQGSLLAPMVAVEHPEVACVVLVAAIGRPMREVFVAQHAARVRAMGLPEATVSRVGTLARQVVDVILSDAADAVRKERLTPLAEELDRLVAGDPLAAMAPWSTVDRLVTSALTPAMKDLLATDPRPVLERLRVPTLVLGAELDLQVDAASNLEAIGESLRKAGNPDHQVVLLRGLNHLMQPSKTGLQDEYGVSEMAYDPEFMRQMVTWLEARLVDGERRGGQDGH